MDVEAINKEEFSELIKTVLVIVMRSHNQEKLKASANLLSNILLKKSDFEKLSYTELDHFARALEGLSNGGIEFFGRLVKIVRHNESQSGLIPQFYSIDSLTKEFEYSDTHLISGLARELNGWYLVHLTVPQIRSRDDGNTTLMLTELGRRFAKAVSLNSY